MLYIQRFDHNKCSQKKSHNCVKRFEHFPKAVGWDDHQTCSLWPPQSRIARACSIHPHLLQCQCKQALANEHLNANMRSRSAGKGRKKRAKIYRFSFKPFSSRCVWASISGVSPPCPLARSFTGPIWHWFEFKRVSKSWIGGNKMKGRNNYNKIFLWKKTKIVAKKN